MDPKKKKLEKYYVMRSQKIEEVEIQPSEEMLEWIEKMLDKPKCFLLPLSGLPDVFTGNSYLHWKPRAPVSFAFNEEAKRLEGVVYFGANCEGAPDTVHGGCTSAILDSTCGMMCIVASSAKTFGMTVYLHGLKKKWAKFSIFDFVLVYYKAKIPLKTTASIECKVASIDGRKMIVKAKLFRGDVIFAEAESLLLTAKL